ncbi:MAG: hypothetical protein M4D80_41950 [Myxococcota bacterium]|nr:hypothetical protein [Myxococcota bacterium]
MKRIVLLSLLLVACGKKSTDKCERVIDKSMRVLGEIAALRGAKLGPAEKKELVAQCKKAAKAGHTDPQTDCVLAAADDAGVRKCYIQGYENHLARSKEIEAKLQLTSLGNRAKAVFVEKAEFPKGKVGPTPATPCCGEQIKQCIPTDATWSDPVWQALGFTVEGAFHFQYSYESDGKTFTATATGDIGCAGKPTTTTLTGKVGADGAPELSKL